MRHNNTHMYTRTYTYIYMYIQTYTKQDAPLVLVGEELDVGEALPQREPKEERGVAQEQQPGDAVLFYLVGVWRVYVSMCRTPAPIPSTRTHINTSTRTWNGKHHPRPSCPARRSATTDCSSTTSTASSSASGLGAGETSEMEGVLGAECAAAPAPVAGGCGDVLDSGSTCVDCIVLEGSVDE